MDALVAAAQDKVNETIGKANPIIPYTTGTIKKFYIARAINAVDALKSALKAL